jgi:hypothetical protein
MNHRAEHDDKPEKRPAGRRQDGELAGEHGKDPGEGHHGYSPDVGQASDQLRQAGDRAFGPPPPGPQWPGREPSKVERRGVPATDTSARTPLGVGTSTSRRGERIAATEGEAGRRGHGVRGKSRRPAGKSAPEHDTGVAPEAPIDEESPQLPTGDQAG